ncbi:MAG: 4-(cytidine 5'-diphospho)-2-C-methyl-D-erythritol kinase [candidate division WOR-3 bacterium]
MEQHVIKSYAKINLGLWVTEKRPDGYHNIVTVFHKIGLYDTITIKPNFTFQVLTTGEEIEERNNILYKVKELVEKKFGVTVNEKVEIFKRIPVGSGLGGASSNAAYYLKYLNEKLSLRLTTKELIEIGKEIGSDVPFFLLGENAAIATGRGEILEPVKSKFNFPLIVGLPKCKIITRFAYESFDRIGKFSKFLEAYRKATKIAEALEGNDLQTLQSEIENDFEEIATTYCGEIMEIKETLYALGAIISSLSGSGSALYGIFDRMIFLENYGDKLIPTSFLEME